MPKSSLSLSLSLPALSSHKHTHYIVVPLCVAIRSYIYPYYLRVNEVAMAERERLRERERKREIERGWEPVKGEALKSSVNSYEHQYSSIHTTESANVCVLCMRAAVSVQFIHRDFFGARSDFYFKFYLKYQE